MPILRCSSPTIATPRVSSAISRHVAGVSSPRSNRTSRSAWATVRLALAGEDAHGAVVDLLFASSGIEPEVVAAAESIEAVPGFSIPVARVGHLIALKVLARDDRTRPNDRVDIAALLASADAPALAEARASLALIEQRRFHRGRDVIAALDAAVNEFR
jgi:hypothetical protein